jgi:hypothetical protein
VAIATLLAGSLPCVLAAPKKPAVPKYEKAISQWIADLNSVKFQTRRMATKKLIEIGKPGISLLTDAALEGEPEVVLRALAVLEALYIGSDAEATDSAEEALDKLLASKSKTAANRARLVVEANYAVRQKRALVQIEKLGGKIVRYSDQFSGRTIQLDPNDPDPIQYILLGTSWKGGDNGLKHIKRLTQLRNLYLISGTISEKAEEELKVSMPQMTVQKRGKAYLGISGSQTNPVGKAGCYVSIVTPNGPASSAGIRPGDIIVEFGGKPVAGFQPLIEMIGKRDPKEKIKAIVERRVQQGGVTVWKKFNLEVEMGTWKQSPGVAPKSIIPRPRPSIPPPNSPPKP